MSDCPNLAGCPFVQHCNTNDASMSVKGFIKLFCQSPRQDDCIRKRLCDQYGKQVVPKNMMPNGKALSGSTKDGWSEEALNYRKALA